MLRYATTIFLGAFLLFLIQPLIGKFILPWFGGGPGVWTTCLVFFQVVLLAGYAYAHLIVSRLPPRGQMIVHLLVLAAAIAQVGWLRITPDQSWKPIDASDPTWRILLLLATTLGVPYVALSATGPLLQAWFARTHRGVSPYRLYALSNVGSLLALVAYPFLMEPVLTRQMQAMVWSGCFAAFALLCAWCAVWSVRAGAAVRTQEDPKPEGTAPPAASGVHRLLWVLLPMCASVMLLAVTSRITQDVAPVPFLWVLPLGVYLVTFIIAFEWPRLYWRAGFVVLLPVAMWLLVWMMHREYVNLWMQVAAHVAVLFVCGMICHGEAYRLRPAAERLTSYYLAISLGGALGGLLVSVAAPLVLNGSIEYELGLYGCFALAIGAMMIDPASSLFRGAHRPAWLVLTLAVVASAVAMQRREAFLHKDVELRVRNFYGVLKVNHQNIGRPDEFYRLEHGAITHGAQYVDPRLHRQPLMYFGVPSGIGLLLASLPRDHPLRVGIIGLGVGTIATYGRAGDSFTFYEINPMVKEIAEADFAYLSESAATVDVRLGDARLTLEREPPQQFDVLAIDAFNGDAIPVHLLTMEAFDIYERHLRSGGVIAVHATNSYLALPAVLGRLARERGMEMMLVVSPTDKDRMLLEAHWVLLTRDPQVFALQPLASKGVVATQGFKKVRLWTDERTSLLQIMK